MESNRSSLFVYYRWLLLLLASGLCLFPLWATFIGGFKSTGDLRTNAFGLPKQWLTDNYVSIATSGRFWQMLGNSAFNVINGNNRMTPTEVFEMRYPWRVERNELVPDSGGPGKYRGGLGTTKTLLCMNPAITVSFFG